MEQVKNQKEDLQDKLRLYVKERLLMKLNLDNSEFTIKPTDKGRHSLITFLEIKGFRPLVIRGVRKKYKLKRIVRNNDYLKKSGFNIPEILCIDHSRKVHKEFGHYIAVEEKIAGKCLSEFENHVAHMPLIAKAFSHLHSINSDKWGMVGSEKKTGFFRYINAKIQNELRQIVDLDENFFSSKEIKEYAEWFKAHKNLVKNCPSFSLCHGDPYLTNVLITGDNKLYLLDNDHTKYFPMATEFYKLGFLLNQDDPDRMSGWQNLYCSGLSEKLREEFEKSKNFYLAYTLLHIAFGLLEDSWRRWNPYSFSPARAKTLIQKCVENSVV